MTTRAPTTCSTCEQIRSLTYPATSGVEISFGVRHYIRASTGKWLCKDLR